MFTMMTEFTHLHLRNDLYCVGWGVKLYSLSQFTPQRFHRSMLRFDVQSHYHDWLHRGMRHGTCTHTHTHVGQRLTPVCPVVKEGTYSDGGREFRLADPETVKLARSP